MKIIVIGAGVIGVMSAYFLVRAGCQVTVIERQSGSALETSFANAGQISPGLSAPWAGPGVPSTALDWLFRADSPLIFRPKIDPAQWRWMVQFLLNCNGPAYDRNKQRMVRLAEYSRDVLDALRAEHELSFDHGTDGILQLFQTQDQMREAKSDVTVLERLHVEHELLDSQGCIAAEPGLEPVKERFVGGLRLVRDQTGNCHLFTQQMTAICQKLGVQFWFGVEAHRFHAENRSVSRLQTSTGDLAGDAYVLAAASGSPRLAAGLGLGLPVYPVKGYSVSAPIINHANAPRSSILDETNKVAITRLGDQVRIGGTAEISGYGGPMRKSRLRTLINAYSALFPTVGEVDEASFWSGLRPMTPDGTPIVGPTRYGNLFINTGHGTLGWTMACGAGKVISDIVTSTPTEIASHDLALSRYSYG